VSVRHPRAGTRSGRRLAYWLIAPAVVFMVLVHLVPSVAGVVLSF
jgi:multiple sugar transport system permease protein